MCVFFLPLTCKCEPDTLHLQRERQFEQRERARIAAWEREQAREQGIAEQEERDRAYMAERLATWDDDREAERGRELFYIDRCVRFFA